MALFKPHRVVPNTLDPTLKGLDALCMKAMFAGCLADDSSSSYCASTLHADFTELNAAVRSGIETKEDVAFQNLEGSGAREIAEKWADSGRMKRKLNSLKEYLPEPYRNIVEQIIDGRYQSNTTVKTTKPLRRNDTELPSSPACAPEKPAFQGRASEAESRAAMARISFSVPKALRSPEPDSDSDDEKDHEAMANFLWADEASTPYKRAHRALRGSQASSSSPLSVTQQPQQQCQPLAGPSRMPLTPTSRRGDSQDLSLWLRSSSPPPEDHTPRARTRTQDVFKAPDENDQLQPCTPRRAQMTLDLGSPIELSAGKVKGKEKAKADFTPIPMPLTPDTKTRRARPPVAAHTTRAPALSALPLRLPPRKSVGSQKASLGQNRGANPNPVVDLRGRKRSHATLEIDVEPNVAPEGRSPKRRRASVECAQEREYGTGANAKLASETGVNVDAIAAAAPPSSAGRAAAEAATRRRSVEGEASRSLAAALNVHAPGGPRGRHEAHALVQMEVDDGHAPRGARAVGVRAPVPGTASTAAATAAARTATNVRAAIVNRLSDVRSPKKKLDEANEPRSVPGPVVTLPAQASKHTTRSIQDQARNAGKKEGDGRRVAAEVGVGAPGRGTPRSERKAHLRREQERIAARLASKGSILAAPLAVPPTLKARVAICEPQKKGTREGSSAGLSTTMTASVADLVPVPKPDALSSNLAAPQGNTSRHKSRLDDPERKGSERAVGRPLLLPLLSPSQDESPGEESEARVKAIRAGFEAHRAKGELRPGQYVPRLRCLQSQEAEEVVA